jgi:hypothetical protein
LVGAHGAGRVEQRQIGAEPAEEPAIGGQGHGIAVELGIDDHRLVRPVGLAGAPLVLAEPLGRVLDEGDIVGGERQVVPHRDQPLAHREVRAEAGLRKRGRGRKEQSPGQGGTDEVMSHATPPPTPPGQ